MGLKQRRVLDWHGENIFAGGGTATRLKHYYEMRGNPPGGRVQGFSRIQPKTAFASKDLFLVFNPFPLGPCLGSERDFSVWAFHMSNFVRLKGNKEISGEKVVPSEVLQSPAACYRGNNTLG